MPQDAIAIWKPLLLAGVLAASPCAANAQDVAVLALTCTPKYGGHEVEGEIKNLSSQPLSDVFIICTFLDANGRFISASDGTGTKFNPILPGQTSPFDDYGGLNPVITKVTVALSILNGPALAASGISSAPCGPS